MRVEVVPRRVVPLGIVALAFTVALAVGVSSIDTDFETDPLADDWVSSTPPGEDGNLWTDEQAFSGSRSLRIVEGGWLSPFVEIEPFSYYEISFRGLASGRGFFGPSYKAASDYVRDGAWARNSTVFRGRHDRSEVRVFFGAPQEAPGYVDDVLIEPVSREVATLALDGLWSSMPVYSFERPVRSRPRLRRTLRTLETGGTLRIVMLGDSIVDDTSHSYFELLIERQYPGSRIEVITSTRNSTGCWWFREVDTETGIPRVHTWVSDHAPDLVMIGGISHGQQGNAHEIESIRDVIRQIRERDPDVDVLLMTELGGTNDPDERPSLLVPPDPAGTDWRARLRRLATEERTAFVDMTTPWARYVHDTGIPFEHLLRDDIHMNSLGSAVAGRILEAWLAPEGPPRPPAGETGRRHSRSRTNHGGETTDGRLLSGRFR